ncbi:hypothetical protein ACP275_10G111400 [Erythranthe tilingii]
MWVQDKNSKLSSGNSIALFNKTLAYANYGNLVGLKKLFSQNPSLLNERSISGLQTALHIAAASNRVEVIQYFLEWKGPGKVELEAKNIYGETPLHLAAKNGCNEAIMMLLDYGANVEAKTNQSMTALHLAVDYARRSGDNSTVKTLSQYNADFSAIDDEDMIQADLCNEELLRLLCRNMFEQINITKPKQINVTKPSYKATDENAVNTSSNSSTHSSPSGYQTSKQPIKKYEFRMKRKMDEFDQELSMIVGLHALKLQLRKWAKGMLFDEKRRAMGIKLGPRKPPHMAFLGNPGTGKTTVARILGNLLHSIVSSILFSHIYARADRRGYRLAPVHGSHSQDFGVEALEEIMSVLEDGNIVVIFAGYTEPMKRVFSSNAGFRRRVTHFFQFDDFTCNELAEMVMIKMSKQNDKSCMYGFKLHRACTCGAVLQVIEKNSTEKLRNKMNGGLVDHMLNNARESLDSRLDFYSEGDELLIITLSGTGLQMLTQQSDVDEKD